MTGISELLLDAGTDSVTITPANFDAFQKTLAMFAKATGPRFINILDSSLLARDAYGLTIYEIDFSSVFPSATTMAFFIARQELQVLGGLGGNSEIILLEDDSHFFLAGETGLVPLKKYRGTAPKITVPDLENAQQMGDTVHLAVNDSILRAVKNAKWTGLLTHDGQLTGFITPDSALRLFSNKSGPEVIGSSPDAVYKAHSFLKLAGSSADLSLYNLDGQVWLKTVTNIGKPRKGGTTNVIGPAVTTYERLLPASLNDFQSLFSLLSKSN